jgi:hypothetical protein
MALLECEKVKANLRMIQGKKIDPVANSPQAETGKTRDIIAEKVGLKSGRDADRAMLAVRKIDTLKDNGDNEKADRKNGVVRLKGKK